VEAGERRNSLLNIASRPSLACDKHAAWSLTGSESPLAATVLRSTSALRRGGLLCLVGKEVRLNRGDPMPQKAAAAVAKAAPADVSAAAAAAGLWRRLSVPGMDPPAVLGRVIGTGGFWLDAGHPSGCGGSEGSRLRSAAKARRSAVKAAQSCGCTARSNSRSKRNSTSSTLRCPSWTPPIWALWRDGGRGRKISSSWMVSARRAAVRGYC
jgi:hypothetical protein